MGATPLTAAHGGAPASVLREEVERTLRRLSRTGAVPTIAPAATAALALARDPDADRGKLCQVIRGDVGLTARVLRMANSAVFGRRVAASDIEAAVLALGMRRTCDILVGVCTRQMYATPCPHAEGQWEHALTVAVAAQELATAARCGDADLAFLTGLFHDVGRFALILTDPQAVEIGPAVVDASREVEIERRRYGVDHAECGAVLAEEWGLAAEQVTAIRFHHEPMDGDGPDGGLAAVLRAADAVARRLKGEGPAGPLDDAASAPVLGLSPEDEAACVDRIGAAVLEYQELLG